MFYNWQTDFGTFTITLVENKVSKLTESTSLEEALPPELKHNLDLCLQGKASLIACYYPVNALQAAVSRALRSIPFGETRTYREVAQMAGYPDAIRAVATAVGKNPIPLLIPCHRVIRTDGSYGEYSLVGPELKKRLLEFEKQ